MKAMIYILFSFAFYFEHTSGQNIDSFIEQFEKNQDDVDTLVEEIGEAAIGNINSKLERAKEFIGVFRQSVNTLTSVGIEGVCLKEPANLTLAFSKSFQAYGICLEQKRLGIISLFASMAGYYFDISSSTRDFFKKLSAFDGVHLSENLFVEILQSATGIIRRLADFIYELRDDSVGLTDSIAGCVKSATESSANEYQELVNQLANKCPK